MARGTYISENLTKHQFKVMLLLDEEDIEACKQFALKMMDQKDSLKDMAA